MLPIQAHKLLQMERAWLNSKMRSWLWVGGLCSQCEVFSVNIFPLKCPFQWRGVEGGCHGNKHGAGSFCLAILFTLCGV